MAFQPHPRLTLVYTQDGFETGARVTREAWAMIGLTPDYYLRAGVFRSPFGLRMDDHTVATRNGFTDFQPLGAFVLPTIRASPTRASSWAARRASSRAASR